MNIIKSNLSLSQQLLFQLSLWKHQANAVKKNSKYRVGKRKGKNQQNREDERAPEIEKSREEQRQAE